MDSVFTGFQIVYNHNPNVLNFTHVLSIDMDTDNRFNGPFNFWSSETIRKIALEFEAWCTSGDLIRYTNAIGVFPNQTDYSLDKLGSWLYIRFQNKTNAMAFKLRFG